jgi:hypothetical protein
MPFSVPSMRWPELGDQTLLTAWKSVVPLSAGLRPEVE